LTVKAPVRTFDRTMRIAGRTIEVMVAPIVTSDRTAVFVATFDMTGLAPARSAAIRLALAEGAVALAAGIVGAYVLLRRLLRRIGTITDTAERIGRGRLAERLGDQGTADEVGRLARSFDSMLDRIQDAVVAQEQLLSDVSHQLRTPLTVAKGHLEILQRSGHTDPASVQETLEVAIAELNRMTRLVERVLELGLAREPRRPDLHDVDLRAFLADFVASCQVLADRRWSLAGVPDAVMRIDETEVRGALLNLVDNSVRATDDGDAIAVSARLDDGVLCIEVEDSGPGIPAQYRDQVLDRYWRPGSRDGSGLGLAIAREVCRAHEGEIRIGDSPLGGARVTLVLRSLDGAVGGSG
jgi:signal transduction histidine kinase